MLKYKLTGGPFFTFSLPGERRAPLPPVSYATAGDCNQKYFGETKKSFNTRKKNTLTESFFISSNPDVINEKGSDLFPKILQSDVWL